MFGLGFTRLFWFSRGIRHQVHFKKNVFGSDIYYQMLNNVLLSFSITVTPSLILSCSIQAADLVRFPIQT